MATLLKIPSAVKKAFLAAKKNRGSAYAPYSKFQVGAAIVSAEGEIFSGCNVENASYGSTICAERVAILKGVSQKSRRFVEVVVVTDSLKPAYPCANCLQVMAEFFEPKARIWVANLKGICAMHEFSELLPKPFGPRQLLEAEKNES